MARIRRENDLAFDGRLRAVWCFAGPRLGFCCGKCLLNDFGKLRRKQILPAVSARAATPPTSRTISFSHGRIVFAACFLCFRAWNEQPKPFVTPVAHEQRAANRAGEFDSRMDEWRTFVFGR